MAAALYPIAEVAGRVGGDLVRVTDITPPGAEAHDVELAADDVDVIEDADLVLYIGDGFQPAVEELAERKGGSAVNLLEAVDAIEGDPHFWLDPRRLAKAVDAIEKAMSMASPDDAAVFRSNAEALRAELDELDTDYERSLADCERRDIVVAHESYGYLAARYDLEQLAITGIAPEAEADPAQLARLATQIEARGVTTVFAEPGERDTAEALARETGTTAETLSPLETLTREQRDAGEDYFAVMRENLEALRAALSCS